MKNLIYPIIALFITAACSEQNKTPEDSKAPELKEIDTLKKQPLEVAMSDSMMREHFFPLDEGELIEDYRDLSAKEIPKEAKSEKYEYRIYSLTEKKWVEEWTSYYSIIKNKEYNYRKTDSTAKWVIKVREIE